MNNSYKYESTMMSGKRGKGDIVDSTLHLLDEAKAEINRLRLELRKLKKQIK